MQAGPTKGGYNFTIQFNKFQFERILSNHPYLEK